MNISDNWSFSSSVSITFSASSGIEAALLTVKYNKISASLQYCATSFICSKSVCVDTVQQT